MKIITALLLSCALVTITQAAEQGVAATLQDINGKVLINKGSGLVSGKVGVDLKDGDRIVTLDKSGARIVFTDGCTVTLEENKIFLINAELGCKALPVASNPAPAPVAGLTATQGLLIGAAYVGGAAAIGNSVFDNNRNDNRPISSQ